jgi:xanthine dehydrogenase accessory factor
MNQEILELAVDLRRQHRPFVMATVVWRRGPTSGKQGSTAIVEADGTVHGWIGGACAAPAVLRQARNVIMNGEPCLMYMGPADELDGSNRKGVVTVPIACASEGALEVFMEPMLPQPHVVVIGRSPAVTTLVGLLEALEWRTTVVDDGAVGEGPNVITSLAGFNKETVGEPFAVVVATQGQYDEPALEAALSLNTGHIALVGSRKRTDSVIGYLRDQGVNQEQLDRIQAPAGLDLGEIENKEIAVAILADLVRLRALSRPKTESATHEPKTAIDPICGMTVDIEGARFVSEISDVKTYFCCPACKNQFEKAASQ